MRRSSTVCLHAAFYIVTYAGKKGDNGGLALNRKNASAGGKSGGQRRDSGSGGAGGKSGGGSGRQRDSGSGVAGRGGRRRPALGLVEITLI